jgi:hypothetical protein
MAAFQGENMNIEQDQLSRDFKQTFASESGQNVLRHLRTYCRANPNQGCFDSSNPNQTNYNLGANSVYRYIQYQIEMKLEQKTKDCIIEEPKGE